MTRQIRDEYFTLLTTNSPDVEYMAQVKQMLVSQPNPEAEMSS